MSKKKLAKTIVYGCQMNESDAERMNGELESIGYEMTDDMTAADIILLVTCCVRETAEDKVYGKIGEIKHLKENKPELILGVTGCMAQKEGEALIKRAPHIDFVLGTNKIHQLPEIVRSIEKRHVIERENTEESNSHKAGHFIDVEESETELPDGIPVDRKGTLSAWIPVMYGCNNFCTYCIVPYVRGRERSRLPENVIAEVAEAVRKGYKEVTLLGQNVNSYGKDHNKADFAELLEMTDRVPGIERIRYMTSHPKDLSDRVIAAVKNGTHICEHFHLPVQYGTDHMLKRMNRVYTVAQYKDLIRKIRSEIPDCSITTDLIVGFPGETDDDFESMLEFLKEIRYDAAYTFIYSKRSGTPAANYPDQVPEELKKERLHKLMEVQNTISLEINERLNGTVQEVMAEGPSRNDPSVWTGRTRTGKIVLWGHEDERPGDMLNIRITKPQTWVLKGIRENA